MINSYILFVILRDVERDLMREDARCLDSSSEYCDRKRPVFWLDFYLNPYIFRAKIWQIAVGNFRIWHFLLWTNLNRTSI